MIHHAGSPACPSCEIFPGGLDREKEKAIIGL
jgi:hypothetical protein